MRKGIGEGETLNAKISVHRLKNRFKGFSGRFSSLTPMGFGREAVVVFSMRKEAPALISPVAVCNLVARRWLCEGWSTVNGGWNERHT
jgi:hypothetical protein